MSAAVDAHVARLDQAGQGTEVMPLACIDSNVPTSPRSAKKQRLIPACRSPATPSQPLASPPPSGAARAAPAAGVPPPSPFAAAPAPAEADPLSEALSTARELLRDPSATGGAPLGREAQHERISSALSAFAAGGRGEALYVSGLPGTGKSHTVSRALAALDAGGCAVTWINCMAVAGAGEVYGRIHAAARGASGGGGGGAPTAARMTPGKRKAQAAGGFAAAESTGSLTVSYEQLLAALRGAAGGGGGGGSSISTSARKRRGSSGGGGSSSCGGGCGGAPRVVVILDEVDALVGKGQQGVYGLFMLPHQPGARVFVIGIANSIDLTERALPALKLRGCTPALVPFPAYSTAQVAGILGACLEQLPERLVEPNALELCARQVSSTSGDLRLAIKACRSALDALALARAQHFAATAGRGDCDGVAAAAPPAAAARGPPASVGVRDIMAALGRLAGIRSTQHGAATVASIRALPNQQQLLLYSLSVLCTPPADAADGGSTGGGGGGCGTPQAKGRTAASLWAEAAPGSAGGRSAAKSVRARTPARGGAAAGGGASSAAGLVGRRLFGAAGGGGGKPSSGAGPEGFVLAVGLEDTYTQYCKVCRLVGMAAATRAELRHMADLLAQMALLDVIDAPAPGGGGASGGGATPGGPGARRKGPRGFGGAAGGGGAAAGAAAGAQLTLRAGHDEVHRALSANPALRCLVDDA